LLYDESVNNNNMTPISFFDGGHKVASVQQKKLRVWQTRTGRDLAKVDLPLRAQELAFKLIASPKGSFFALMTVNNGGENNQSRGLVWDLAKKKLIREWGTPNREDHLRFSPDEQWLAAAGNGTQIRLMRIQNPRGDHTLQLGKKSL